MKQFIFLSLLSLSLWSFEPKEMEFIKNHFREVYIEVMQEEGIIKINCVEGKGAWFLRQWNTKADSSFWHWTYF